LLTLCLLIINPTSIGGAVRDRNGDDQINDARSAKDEITLSCGVAALNYTQVWARLRVAFIQKIIKWFVGRLRNQTINALVLGPNIWMLGEFKQNIVG
jgi:hypothetical protein